MRNNTLAAGEPDSWNDWFRVILILLARGYPMDDAVIVKAPDLCSWMGNLLLDHDASTKVVFLFAPLKVFLLHVFKAKWRRQWLREHVQYLSRPMTQVPFLSATAATDLTGGQRAAAIWLLNSFLFRSLLVRPDSHRLFVLNGEDLISRPKQAVLAVAEFFGLADKCWLHHYGIPKSAGGPTMRPHEWPILPMQRRNTGARCRRSFHGQAR